MYYIGMDCHVTTLDFAEVNEAGRLVKADRVATNVNGFIEFVKKVPPRTIYMEESTLAAWALEICVRFGEKLVITDAKKNHWIGSSGQKDDSIDALKLAQLARDGIQCTGATVYSDNHRDEWKRREVQSGNKRKGSLQTGLGWSLC